jgi:hypothetical protein
MIDKRDYMLFFKVFSTDLIESLRNGERSSSTSNAKGHFNFEDGRAREASKAVPLGGIYSSWWLAFPKTASCT